MAFHWFKRHTKDGLEIPDPTPIEITVSERPLTLAEQIARFCADPQLMKAAVNHGVDTFDEAEDFDVKDDGDDFISPYVQREMGDEEPDVVTRLDEIRAGVVEDVPQDRHERAQDALRRAKSASKDFGGGGNKMPVQGETKPSDA